MLGGPAPSPAPSPGITGRLAGYAAQPVPGPARQFAIGGLIAAVALVLRAGIELLVPGVVVFAFIFPAVAAGALLGGWRSGLTVVAICQVLSWYLFLPNLNSFAFDSLGSGVSLVLTTVIEIALIWLIMVYRAALVGLAQAEAARALELQMALAELDHRTMNNFQLAAAVLRSQGAAADDPRTTAALAAASDRLMVLAGVHRSLGQPGADLSQRPVAPLLAELIEGLRQHVPDGGIVLRSALAEVSLGHDAALRLGLIVNELVTNALKHAFPDGRGEIVVELAVDAGDLRLTVADDGVGARRGALVAPVGAAAAAMLVRRPHAQGASGTRLVDSLARALGGTLDRRVGAGTCVELRMPLAGA